MWHTGYAKAGRRLVIFANLGVAGKTGHNLPNSYDADTGEMEWYGKINAHSAQPIFRDLFRGDLTPNVFVRWDATDLAFTYLGVPTIDSFRDAVGVEGGFTIQLKLRFKSSMEELAWVNPEGATYSAAEGGRVLVEVNRYERNPRLRRECIAHHGPICKICAFDFGAVYGAIGTNYCHVHHIRPLSEMLEESHVDPLIDLIPVCANCHAMLHSSVPALTPDELRDILRANSSGWRASEFETG